VFKVSIIGIINSNTLDGRCVKSIVFTIPNFADMGLQKRKIWQIAFPTVEWCSAKQGLCHCSYTCGDLIIIQVCSDSAPMLCSTAKGKMHCSVLLCKTGSQQACVTGITSVKGLLSIKECSQPTPRLCSTAQGTMHFPLFSAALQNRLTACLCHWKYTYERFAVHKGVQ